MRTGSCISDTCFRKEKLNDLKRKSQSHSSIEHDENISRSKKEYVLKMEGNPRYRVEKLEDQMIRVSESLNKKISVATNNIKKPKGGMTNQRETQDFRAKLEVPKHRNLKHEPAPLPPTNESNRNNGSHLVENSSKLPVLRRSEMAENKEINKNKKDDNSSRSDPNPVELTDQVHSDISTSKKRSVSGHDLLHESAEENDDDKRVKCVQDINSSEEYHLKNLVYHQSMQCEIEKLKLALVQKDEELRQQLEKKEKDIEEKFEMQINDLIYAQRKLLEEKEANLKNDNEIKNEGKVLGKDLLEAKVSLQRLKDEIEMLKHEFKPSEEQDQGSPNKYDCGEIAKKFEEVKASYEDRMRLLEQEFVTRRSIMANEIEKLKTSLGLKEAEYREKLEMKENTLKEKYMRQIDVITKEHRRVLQNFQNVSNELEIFKGREVTLKAMCDEALENLKKIRTENESVNTELSQYRKQVDENISLKKQLEEISSFLDDTRNSYEKKISSMQDEFESEKLNLTNKIQDLEKAVSLNSQKNEDKNMTWNQQNKHQYPSNLFHNTECPSLEDDIPEKQIILTKLNTLEENFHTLKGENESLTSELKCGKKIIQEMTTNILERQQRLKLYEEKNSEYQTRMTVLQHEFEARKVMMLKEIERLSTALTNKDIELKTKLGNVENHVKDLFQKHIDSMTDEQRKMLHMKEKLSAEIVTLREQEDVLSKNVKDSEQNLAKLKIEHDNLQHKVHCLNIGLNDPDAQPKEKEPGNFEEIKKSYEDRINSILQDFEQRRLVMANEIEKLRKIISSKETEMKEKIEARENEIKSYYGKLVECLSDELKKTLTVAKRNEDLIHEKWNVKLNECREQMRKNMHSLEKQIDILTNNASSRTTQLLKERDDLKSRTSILESDYEQVKRKHEKDIQEKEKRLERVLEDHVRNTEELERLKECISQKDEMIEMLQETVRKECTEREDILRKLDEIQKMSGKTSKINLAKRHTSSESSVKRFPSQAIKLPNRQSSTQEQALPSLKGRLPGYMKGVPLLLPSASYLPPSKSNMPRHPASPKRTGSSKEMIPRKNTKSVSTNGVGLNSPEMKFTVAKGTPKIRKPNKLTRSKSLQASNTRSEEDQSPVKYNEWKDSAP